VLNEGLYALGGLECFFCFFEGKMGGPVSRVSGVHIIGGQELAVFLKLSKTSVLFFALS
jgi:hypothetical protein